MKPREHDDDYYYASPHRESAKKSRARIKAYDAASRRLRENNREEFDELYAEERQRQNVETSE